MAKCNHCDFESDSERIVQVHWETYHEPYVIEEIRQAAKDRRSRLKLVEPECNHNTKVGDNYGYTCMDCGKQLAGYGHWAEFDTCLHQWFNHGDEYRMCTFCETVEKKPDEVEEVEGVQ